ncbi:hypothetical protein NLG97_g1123 [Lecanicillium saksenae]|uniref:Uncharacterized protein n=1 Tax=Lecanicillium saksenae TaxID=468837 RepID=A0ACC1R796_9HYPO|nr:hypothetical protein NLG97_g1123 [Lecanicillium saksenae]
MQSSYADRFDWESITPSKQLTYVPCHGVFQCAHLLLPMDWDAPVEQRWLNTVAIALIKLPANVSDVADPRYKGDLFVNPGGPGMSGVEFVKRRGKYLSDIVNDDSGVFDIMGFDPRGLLHSTPRFLCFMKGNLQGRDLFSQRERADPWLNITLPRVWAKAAAFAQMCDSGNDTSPEASIKSYMSTASVAGDLVGMIEAAGALRGTKLRQLQAMEKFHGREGPKASRVKELLYRPGEEKLQFWGFSYSTTIGAYFASMFPNRVKRMVLDGNSDVQDWSSGRWLRLLSNANRSLGSLYTACFEAGADRCALFDTRGAEAIGSTVLSTLAKLKTDPVPLWSEGMLYPEVLTYEMVIEAIVTALYGPYTKFPTLARALLSLNNRSNLSTHDIESLLPRQGVRLSDDGYASKDCVEEDNRWKHEVDVAVSCADTDSMLHNRSLVDYMKWADDLERRTGLFGSFLSSDSTIACHDWPVSTRFRFDGPFGGTTSHPLLFVGNLMDPAGHPDYLDVMTELFNGSVALSTNASGHCSPAAPGACRTGYPSIYATR